MTDKADGCYDLAIVDPPYGIGVNNSIGRRKGQAKSKHGKIKWDNEPPDQEYFDELFRVSKNQIIWGANHFISLMPYDSSCWIVWDKLFSQEVSFSSCELAYTSFCSVVKRFKYSGTYRGISNIHPTQKPVALYKWLLKNYAKPGDKLVDTHSGSGSFRIAAYDMGFDLDSCEIDEDYFRDNNTRFENHIKQADLFKPEERQKNIYSQPGLI